MLGLLALGDHAVVVAATEQATARYPLQERVWALHALALARSGRQADSLAALRQIRRACSPTSSGSTPARSSATSSRPSSVRSPVLQRTGCRRAAGASPRSRAPAAPVDATTRWGTVGRDRRGGRARGGARPGRSRSNRRSPCWSVSPGSASPASSSDSPRPPRVAASWSRPVGAPRTTAPRRSGRGARRSTTSGAQRRAASWTLDAGQRLLSGDRRMHQGSERATGVPGLGEHRARGARPAPRRPRCSSYSRTCTGRTPPACGCCGG